MHSLVCRLARYVLISCIAGLAAVSPPTSSAEAQESVNVAFPAGQTGTTINGTIIGNEYIDYVLRARGGQTMSVALTVTGTNGFGSAFFNILPAGQDFGGPYIGSTDDDNRAEVVVPSDGDWAIRVYLMGNDRDTGKTVGFSIDVDISSGPSGSGTASPVPPADMLPEEDFFVVRLSSAGGHLNVRDAPSETGSLVGTIANGINVANVGGCTVTEGAQWCEVQAEGGGIRGWVAARFLALPGPAGGEATGGGNVVTIAGVPENDLLNVRNGPGTGYDIVGALGNDDRVVNLGCQPVDGGTWCEIEMLTDMRERGWINARYIAAQGNAPAQLPDAARVVRVQFNAGTSGTEFTDELGPGTSVTYVLGASAGQDLYFRLATDANGVSWRLYNPDGSLLDEGAPSKAYRGELWQTGDHKVEVINRAGGLQRFNVIFGIE